MIYPLRLQEIGSPIITAKIFNNDVCFIVDTGSSENLLKEITYRYFIEIKGIIPNSSSKEINTLYETESVKGSITLPFIFENQEYIESFSPYNSPAFDIFYNNTGTEIDGILGSPFLEKHQWIIDYSRKLLSSNSE